MLSFRQPGDMGRYVADNDPGGIAAGFSNLEDFLAAGNKIPENRKNPYGTEFIGIGADQTNLFGYKVPDYVIKEQEERMKNNPINVSGVLPGLGSLTPLNPVTGAQQATPGTPNTESFSQDVLRDSDGNPLKNFTPIRSPGLPPSNNFVDDMRDKTLPTLLFAEGTGPLQTVQGPNDSLDLFAGRPVLSGDEERVQAPPLLDGTKGFPVSVSGPETIASVNPFEEQFTGFQNQLTSFGDQFSTLGDRLTKLEEGIASLLNKNMSSNFNSMQPAFGHSRYGYSPFSMVGLGSLFGGYYG